jgi:hypothetical protein
LKAGGLLVSDAQVTLLSLLAGNRGEATDLQLTCAASFDTSHSSYTPR